MTHALVMLMGLGASSGVQDPVPGLLAEVSAERIGARIEALVGFGTRHTMSETESETRGIGAARRWIRADLEAAAAATGGRLQVRTQAFEQAMGRRGARRDVELVNVYGFLPGTQGDPKGRTYVVSGHYDSIPSSGMDAESDAPGADDDASGTAVVLELARVMSAYEFEANLVFLCVPGEEQGLFGSKYFASWAHAEGLAIDGMITNDIVGGTVGGNGVEDDRTIRCFSAAEGLHSPSRELARSMREAVQRYVLDAEVELVFRLDRFGRGGDHQPFHELGYPAVRMTEANEDYAHQHQDVREENGVLYGDRLEFVSFDYTARVARANAALLAQLALAPAPPAEVELRAALRYDTEVRWQASPSAHLAGYVVVWRETTAPYWKHASELIEGTSFTAPGVSADNCFFGVRAVGEDGHQSRTAYPRRP